MLLLLTLLSAHAEDCVVDRLDSRVSFVEGAAVRVDDWVLGAEPGATGCRLLEVPPVTGLELVAVQGRIGRPDRRRVRFGEERLLLPTGATWTEPGPVIQLPDADIGSTIDLRLTWRGPSGVVGWSPGDLGPVALVTLAVDGGAARSPSGPLPGGPAWSWAGVPASQPPLELIPDSPPPAVAPTPMISPGPWRLGRTGRDEALAVSPSGLPIRLAAPGGEIDHITLRRAGVTSFVVEAREGAPAVALPGADAPIDVPPASGPPGQEGGDQQGAALDAAYTASVAPGPGCEQAEDGWRCEPGPAGGRWLLPDGAPDPGAQAVSRVDHHLSLYARTPTNAGPNEPPVGRAELAATWSGEGTPPPRMVIAPRAAEALQCASGDVPGPVVGRACRFPAGGGARTWGWTVPVLPVVGSLALAPDGATQGHLAAASPGATVAWTVAGVEGPLEAARAPAGRDGPGVLPVSEARAAWRIARVGDTEVLPDRDGVIQRIALLGIQASLPEPGLPLRFKNRLDPDDLIGEVLSLVRRRVRAAPPIGRGPLSPRPLVSVLRAGWGTAWEQALLLTRYLRQLKIDAVPMPVRPRSAGAGDPASPEGHTAAVVRVQRDGRTHWIAPACVLCAVDELPSSLHEASVLSVELSRLPAASPGTVEVLALEDGGTRVTLDGAAARWLRESLLVRRPEARLAAIPDLLGAPGRTLLSHAGLAEPGARVGLVFDGPATGPALPVVALQGSTDVVLPWAGTFSWSPVPAGASAEPFDNGVVSWSVADGAAILRIATPVAPREAAAMGLATVRRRLEG